MDSVAAKEDVGITALFTSLCDLHLRGSRRVYFVQPKENKDSIKKRLRTRLYDVLFSCLKGPNRVGQLKSGDVDRKLNERETIFAYALQLRQRRKFDKASQLEHLTEQVTSTGDETVIAILQLVVSLIDSVDDKDVPTLVQLGQHLPVVFREKAITPLLPYGPKEYGDSRQLKADDPFYMHYPRELFERGLLQFDLLQTNIFEMTPGSDLSGNGFFSVQGYLHDAHERQTRNTLFGALVHGRKTTLEVKLDLPELNEFYNSMFEIKVPTKSVDLPEDDGFKSATFSSTPSVESLKDEENIWEQAVHYVRSKHYTWETRGQIPGPTERPHLTEAGPQVVDELYNIRLREIHIICPRARLIRRREVSPRQLVLDTLNLLIGVPSHTFALHKDSGIFVLKDGVCLSGVTPDAFRNLVSEFVLSGGYYSKLCQFAQAPILDSFYHKGLVFHAFTGGVRKYLQHYRGVVLSVPQEKTLFQVKILCHRIMEQIRFLAELCQCSTQTTATPELSMSDDDRDFPTGVALLSYLYRETSEAVNSDHYSMLLSLLQTATAPYCLFVQDWVYHGIFRDVYGEFMVEVNTEYLQSRDKQYWRRGYTLTNRTSQECVPLFLTDLAVDIFTCGKALNLLKLCNPKHFMCNVEEGDIPKMMITFSEEDLASLWSRCQVYVSRMKQIARQLSISREQLKERAEQARRDLIQRAREASLKDISRYQAKVDAFRKAQNAKKRREFKELKEQMEQDLQRRAEDRQQEEQENQVYMDQLTRREEMMDREQAELELRAREDIIEFYSKLTEEAAYREQKALWKVRRRQLDASRIDFLMHAEVAWRRELQESLQKEVNNAPVPALPADEEDGGELPQWAERGQRETIQVPGSLEPSLPRWAQKGLVQPLGTVLDVEVKMDDLPLWAQKGLLQLDSQEEPVSVGDGDGGEMKESKPTQSEEGQQDGKADHEIWSHVVRGDEPGIVLVDNAQGRNRVLSSPAKWRPQVKVIGDIMSETVERLEIPTIQIVGDQHATKESEGIEVNKSAVKIVHGLHASKESEPDDRSTQKPQIQINPNMHSSRESQSVESKCHIRMINETNVGKESDGPVESLLVPRLKKIVDKHASMESKPDEVRSKKASVYGHISQLSNMEFVISAPRLKRRQDFHIGMESDFKDFTIKPKIRLNRKISATTETKETESKPHLKMNLHMHASKESEHVDVDSIRLEKFKRRNLYGHSSDSTVQKLLYGETFGTNLEEVDGIEEEIDTVPLDQELDLSLKIFPVEKYMDTFKILDELPSMDPMSGVMDVMYGGVGDYGANISQEVRAYQYTPLAVLLKKCIIAPLLAQISLVNDCVLSYFSGELQINKHFEMLRTYLLMGDGDFAQTLSDILFEKLSTLRRPQELLNPIFLHGALTRSLKYSGHTDDKYAENISFAVKYLPQVLNQNAHDCLDCLELQYKVDWPANIIITDSCIAMYSKVFSFMLQLRRIVWVLKDVWYKLKRDALILKTGSSPHFRQLQLFRQEMQHFVKVMQGYIANQIIHVTWQEFQVALNQDVHNVDQLHQVHAEYLQKALFRCLLNQKAEPVMKIIQDIFSLILKFRYQLISASWLKNSTSGETTHPNFNHMVKSYKVFREYSVFLFMVVNKLAMRGYQPHLQELLLSLNFNNYYTYATQTRAAAK